MSATDIIILGCACFFFGYLIGGLLDATWWRKRLRESFSLSALHRAQVDGMLNVLGASVDRTCAYRDEARRLAERVRRLESRRRHRKSMDRIEWRAGHFPPSDPPVYDGLHLPIAGPVGRLP